VKRMGVCLVAVLAAMLHASGATAQVEDAGEPDPAPDPLGTRNDLADVNTALEVLAEAGVPPTREDMSRFLAEDGQSARTTGGPRLPFQGAVQMRLGHIPRAGWDRYAKVTLDGRWLRIGARLRRYMSGGKEANWSLAAGGDQVELRVGELGLVQGFGLLAAAPGRRASLAADSGLAMVAGQHGPGVRFDSESGPVPRTNAGVGTVGRSWTGAAVFDARTAPDGGRRRGDPSGFAFHLAGLGILGTPW